MVERAHGPSDLFGTILPEGWKDRQTQDFAAGLLGDRVITDRTAQVTETLLEGSATG